MNSKVPQTIEQPSGPEARTPFPGSTPSFIRGLGNHTLDDQNLHLESGPVQNSAAAVLISTDSSLVQDCQRVIDSIPGLTLAVINSTEEIDSFLGREDVILVLKHVVRR